MIKTNQLARFTRSTVHKECEPCRNCDAVYIGNFCPNCGQEAHTGAPTAAAFIYEFLTRNVFERGKLPRTLWHLLRYPGGLTIDFLEGRRQRFIRPVRLYFGLSVLYFLLLSMQGTAWLQYMESDLDGAPKGKVAVPLAGGGKESKPVVAVQVDNADKADKAVAEARDLSILNGSIGISKTKSGVLVTGLPDTGLGGALKKRFERIMNMPEKQRIEVIAQGTLKQAPQAMFFLVPVFAFLLKVLFLFRRIPYGAHLLFAFHYHSAIFLGLLLMLVPGADAGVAVPVSIGLLWVYLPLALRNTYACSWFGAFVRVLVLAFGYAVAIGFALVGAMSAAFLLL